MSQKNIKIDSLSKKYSDSTGHVIQLFENISFEIEKVSSLLAPRGSGKSSLLKMITGIDEEGKVTDGKIVFIPREPSSFPWLNVRENIMFNAKKMDTQRLTELICFVGLEGYDDHYPNNNSIGFRFRISLARAIANNPEAILIDESLTELSQKRKLELYSLLRKVATEKEITILYATSSVTEAIKLSDKIILMSKNPTKIITEKPILIDEEARVDYSSLFVVGDYFNEKEMEVISNSFI
jgi:ABC-type nitrate/sulfonate/bicarbonate transport system ATPase subunit